MGEVAGILRTILERKREEVRALARDRTLRELEDEASNRGPARGFRARIAGASTSRPALIAELKRASPSKGPIAPDVVPEERAALYESAGAAAMSVLTDRDFFSGSLDDLRRARDACGLPVLRKDFVVDPLQVFEARAAGADAVLLIAAALERGPLGELLAAADEIGIDALVEVHDAGEVDRALERGARLVGINNRDLVTFETTLDVTRNLAPEIPATIPVVSESGIRGHEDVQAVGEAGCRAILVGEALMTAEDPEDLVRELAGT